MIFVVPHGNGQSTVGGPKWTICETKVVHFGPFGSRESLLKSGSE